MLKEKWQCHLDTLPPHLARSKGVGSRYWARWFDAISLVDEEVLTAESEPGDDSDCEPIMKPYEEVVDNSEPCSEATEVVESEKGSPPITDDDRRGWPAESVDDQQGGHPESKLRVRDRKSCAKDSLFLPEVLDVAYRNFAKFHEMLIEEVDEDVINAKSPGLGIAGWSDPRLVVLDYDVIESERRARESRRSPWSFGEHDGCDDQETERLNTQMVQLIVALGERGSGRRAILKAVAEKQGIESEDELQALLDGTAKTKLRVPSFMREALTSIGLSKALAPVSVVEIAAGGEAILTAGDAWHDIEFEVALDSGAVVHVCSLEDCPGYSLEESPGSRNKQKFLMGDGGTIPNLGQKSLNLCDEAVDRNLISVFQIAAVTRPLMSVGKICDEGHNITFDAVMAVVREKGGEEICRFHRTSGGLYVAKMKLRSPTGFARQE